MLHWRKITALPHTTVYDNETTDPDFGNASEIRRKTKAQARANKHFNNR